MRKNLLFFTSLLFALLTGFQCRRNTDNISEKKISSELSFTENPWKQWQVGFSKTDKLTLSDFQLSTFADISRSIPLWHPAMGFPEYYPYTGQNISDHSVLDVSGRWALRKGQIAMEASNTGQYSMLRFIVPEESTYRIKAVFEGVHFDLSTTDVHVLLNTQELFQDIIDGYGGDPAFHVITGIRPSSVFETTIVLKKNDILTFAVGYGQNKTHYNDTTGLLITIEKV